MRACWAEQVIARVRDNLRHRVVQRVQPSRLFWCELWLDDMRIGSFDVRQDGYTLHVTMTCGNFTLERCVGVASLQG